MGTGGVIATLILSASVRIEAHLLETLSTDGCYRIQCHLCSLAEDASLVEQCLPGPVFTLTTDHTHQVALTIDHTHHRLI